MRQDVSFHQIRHLCERKDGKQIEVKFVELPSVIAHVLSPLHKVQESSTFQALWTQYGKKAQAARENDEAQKRALSISSVVDNVWKPAYEKWNQLVACAWNGTLTLGDVDKFFESYKDRKKELVQELFCIFKLDQSQTSSNTRQLKYIAERRATQIQLYQQLHQYVTAADKIWEFKESMGLTGDFNIIEDLRNQVSIVFYSN